MSVSKQRIHLRNQKGISQEEVASLMNITQQVISIWGNTDQTLLANEQINRLSEIFGVIIDYPLKRKEIDSVDIYTQHDLKVDTDMSAEVTEILDRVYQMSRNKR